MTASIQALTVILPVGYLLLAFLYLPSFNEWLAGRPGHPRRWAVGTLAALHALLFALHWTYTGRFPVTGVWSALSAQALVVLVLFAWIRLSVQHSGTAPIVIGVVFALQLLASALGPLPPEARPRPAGPALVVHVAASLVATATLILSGIHGALYLALYRMLRLRRYGALVRGLPDLGLLARLTRGAALAGFVLLGIGVNVGIGWAHAAGVDGFSYRDPFVLVMLAIWLHFGVVAFSGRIPGVTAWRASVAATAGFVVMVASVVISVLPDISFHGQH